MKTTSLELSKQLKEAGAKQESEYCWTRGNTDHPKEYLIPVNGAVDSEKHCWFMASAFDCHELLESLPTHTPIEKQKKGYRAEITKDNGYQRVWTEIGDTPAEALGKLKLWCLQNGHCKC